MISRQRVLALMQDTVDTLRRSGVIEHDQRIEDGTILLGNGSELDSLAFVTFVSDLEDRLGRETGGDVYLLFDEIHDFNAEQPHLSAGSLADYVTQMTQPNG
jgi:hypothetical protein